MRRSGQYESDRSTREVPMKRGTVFAVASFLVGSPGAAPGGVGSQPASYVYQGTVRAVQPKTGSLELITGVGFALRLARIEITPATRIASAGATVALGHLVPGDIVRALCRRVNDRVVADTIEKVSLPAPGRVP